MSGLTAKTFESPDEVRSPDKTRIEVVDLADVKAARLTAEPGWRWSECIQPVVGGNSCQAHHVGVIEPGHDAWVVGDEPVVAFEFDSSTAQSFAKPG